MNCAFMRIVCLSLAFILLSVADTASQTATSAPSFAFCTNGLTGCCERFCRGVEVVNQAVYDDVCSPLCAGVFYGACAGWCGGLSALGAIQGLPATSGQIPVLPNSTDIDYCNSVVYNCCIGTCRGFNFADKLVRDSICDPMCTGLTFFACQTACVETKGLQGLLGKEGVANKLLQVLPK